MPKSSRSCCRRQIRNKHWNQKAATRVAADLFGNPLETDLFGSPVYAKSSKALGLPWRECLNPITYTENVVKDFLRYQLTTYSFADPSLHRQMRQLLNLEQTRRTPLLAGPFLSLSHSFRRGPHAQTGRRRRPASAAGRIAGYENVYGHQEKAVRAIVGGAQYNRSRPATGPARRNAFSIRLSASIGTPGGRRGGGH